MVIRTYPQGSPDEWDEPVGRHLAVGPAGRPLSAVVLAAGHGTRMRSARPKPLHRLCGRPMILHVLDALAELPVTRVVVVVGHRAEWVTKTLIEHAPPGMAIEFVEQVEQRGTGDAMSVALTGLPDEDDGDDGDVVVLPGDTPLLRPGTLAAPGPAPTGPRTTPPPCSPRCSTTRTGYGRVVRGRDDAVARVVEHGDATDERARGPRGQHLDLLLQAQRAGPVAAPAQPGQRPGRVLPDRRGRGALRGRPPGRVGGGRGHHGGGRGQRPGPAGGGRGRAARPDQRALDAPGRDHVGSRRPPTSTPRSSLATDVVLLPGVILQGACVVGEHAEIGPDTRLVDTHGRGGCGGRLQRLPAVGHRPRRPHRTVRRAGRGDRGPGRRGGRPGGI